MRTRRILIDVAVLLTLACVAVVGYKLTQGNPAQGEPTYAAPADCDLNSAPCTVDLPAGGRVVLSISPQPIPVVKPLQIDAHLTGATADKVEIDFSGRSMDMGHQRSALIPVGDGRYRGDAMLPVCVTGRMEWLATLHIDTPHGRIAARFVFAAPVAP